MYNIQYDLSYLILDCRSSGILPERTVHSSMWCQRDHPDDLSPVWPDGPQPLCQKGLWLHRMRNWCSGYCACVLLRKTLVWNPHTQSGAGLTRSTLPGGLQKLFEGYIWLPKRYESTRNTLHGYIIITVVKCGMKLLIHSQTSTVQPFEVWDWINNFIPHLLTDEINCPCWHSS